MLVTKFRPCIDLHHGKVKQIVGNSLTENESNLIVNFSSDRSASEFARQYQEDDLRGGHIIMLGSGNDASAISALEAYPNGLQIGGGISIENASFWLKKGASHVIVTSCIFDSNGSLNKDKLEALARTCGKNRLVVDLSCKRYGDQWRVMMDRWQRETALWISEEQLSILANYCDEFLIHATDVEGTCSGIDESLVAFLADYSPLKSTYAGGVQSLSDLDRVQALSKGRVDVTIGSALDIFGSTRIKYKDCVSWNNANAQA